jgi:two-component system, LytTR family, sensor kinase
MTAASITPHNIQELENGITETGNEEKRLYALSELASFYTFTSIREAQRLLAEQLRLLQKYQHPDLLLRYHLNTAIVENQFYNYRLSEMHFQEAVKIVDDEGDAHQKIEVYLDFSGTLMNKNDLKLAQEYIEKAKRLLVSFPNDILFARLLAREGNLWLDLSDYDQATELLFQADKEFSNITTEPLSIKDTYLLTLVHANLGSIFEKTGDLQRCVASYEKVIDMCEKAGIRSRLTWHYVNIGKVFMELNELDSAVEYFGKADSIKDDISLSARAHATANLGHAFYLGGRYDEALMMYNHAEQIIKRSPEMDYDNMSVISRWKGLLFDAIGKPKRAEKRFEEALEMAHEAKNLRQQAIVCNDLASFYADNADYRKAYEFERLHAKFVKLTYEETNKNKISELEFKYEAERRQQEAEKLRLQATGLQLKALRAQMNPHFIFNALNSLQSYINAESEDREFAAKYLAKFAKLMRDSLEYSELEVISLENEIKFLEDYLMINQKLRFGERLQFDIKVDEDIEDDIVGVPTMIVQPYIENAIEHGLRPKRGGLIRIQFRQDYSDDVILCTIEDNGIGRAKAREFQERDGYHQRHKSRGTAITEKRLEILNLAHKDALSVRIIDLFDPLSKLPCGTRVEVTIPIVELPMIN